MKSKPTISYGPAFDAHGYKWVRFVENVSRGLRLVGFADEIAKAEGSWRSIQHTGWFTDDDQSEKYRGVVYQLPSRGEPLYVYGYADTNNDDCAGVTTTPHSRTSSTRRSATVRPSSACASAVMTTRPPRPDGLRRSAHPRGTSPLRRAWLAGLRPLARACRRPCPAPPALRPSRWPPRHRAA